MNKWARNKGRNKKKKEEKKKAEWNNEQERKKQNWIKFFLFFFISPLFHLILTLLPFLHLTSSRFFSVSSFPSHSFGHIFYFLLQLPLASKSYARQSTTLCEPPHVLNFRSACAVIRGHLDDRFPHQMFPRFNFRLLPGSTQFHCLKGFHDGNCRTSGCNTM